MVARERLAKTDSKKRRSRPREGRKHSLSTNSAKCRSRTVPGMKAEENSRPEARPVDNRQQHVRVGIHPWKRQHRRAESHEGERRQRHHDRDCPCHSQTGGERRLGIVARQYLRIAKPCNGATFRAFVVRIIGKGIAQMRLNLIVNPAGELPVAILFAAVIVKLAAQRKKAKGTNTVSIA